jgi:hypothetical protein
MAELAWDKLEITLSDKPAREFGYYPSIFLENLKKTTNITVKTSGAKAEILTIILLNTSIVCCHYTKPLGSKKSFN